MIKRLILTAFLALAVCPLAAQDWSQNPNQPSLLLLAEGMGGPAKLDRPGIYSHNGMNLAAQFSAVLELPASNRSNLLLKAAVGHRQDDVLTNSLLGKGKLTDWGFSVGIGVRLLFGQNQK